MSGSRKIDVATALSFAVLGGALGGFIVWHYLLASFYQFFMPEIVHHVCGQGWVRHDVQPKALLDFLMSRTTSFDCDSLAAPLGPTPKNMFLEVHLYLAKLVDFVWRHSALEYRNLWPVAALLVGAYTGGVFVLMRMFFSRSLAIIGAAVLTFSPIHIGMIMFVRDYSKAPFFIWSLVFTILATRSPTGGRTVLYAALGGAFIGLGYGFRQDIIIMLPLGVVMLAATCSTIRWRNHCMAAIAFASVAIAVASPMLKLGNSGAFGSPFMQGLSEPYRKYLSLGEAPYSFGVRYSDELTLSSIAADLSAHDPVWESREPQPWAGMTQSLLQSGNYVLRWLPLFSGDVVTQALKSALWIVGLPAIASAERLAIDWGIPAISRPTIAVPGAYFYSWIAQDWLPWAGFGGLLVLLWQIWSIRRREAFALALVFSGLLSYSVLQFALRHVFHLEFLWVAAVLALLRTPFHFREMAESARTFFLMVSAFAAVVLGLRAALVGYQDHALRAKFEQLSSLPREAIPLDSRSNGGSVLLGVPVPDRAKELIEGLPDSMDNTMASRGTQWKVLAMVDRWLITVDSASCPVKTLTLAAEYRKRPTVWQPLDQKVTFDVRPGKTLILMPAFYRATQYLPGITLPQEVASCVSGIERITGETVLPSILSAVLEPDWRKQPLHRALGDFALRPREEALPRWQ